MLLTGVSPFAADTAQQTLRNIADPRKWSPSNDLFKNLSHDAKDFVQRLLLADPKERMTATQALSHPWIHFGLQQQTTSAKSTGLDKQSLLDLHSRTIWHQQTRNTEPWLKLQSVSRVLVDGEEASIERNKAELAASESLSISAN
ncbi:unnamed protein product [Sphagnum balticum]